jgi:hypothetical protein
VTPEAKRPLRARMRRSFEYYLTLFIEGDQGWGQIRLAGALVVILFSLFIARVFQTAPAMPFLDTLEIPPALRPLVEFFVSFLLPQTWRHLIPPLLGFVLALYMGARFLQNLLELPAVGQAWSHITTSLFGGAYPTMTVIEGRVEVPEPDTNPLLKIGGPGWVEIKLGNAAIFERGAGPSAVRGAGVYFMPRWETLREAFDLREVERSRTEVPVFTKDGIPLVLDGVRVRFRLRTRGKRTEAEPYPVLVSAVRRAAYNRTVSEKGLSNWSDMVTGAAVGTITGWISKRLMNELIAPPVNVEDFDGEEASPRNYRQSLHLLFQQGDTRKRFADMGAEILWVSVGHLRPDPNIDPDVVNPEDAQGRDRIHGQMVETWKSQSQALMLEEEAEAQGYAEWLNDTARVQAQVEMIQTITRGLRSAHDLNVPISDLILARGMEYITSVGDTATMKKLAETKPNVPPGAVLGMLEEGKK